MGVWCVTVLHSILLYLNALKIFVGRQRLYATQENLFHRAYGEELKKINYILFPSTLVILAQNIYLLCSS